MKDYARFLNKYYRKMPKIEGYHIFSCNRSDMKETTMPMKIQECNLEDALSYETNAYKIRFDGRLKDITYAEAVKLRRDLIRNTDINTIPSPGINPYKQFELYKNYRPYLPQEFQDVTCPKPSDEIFSLIKKEKDSKIAIKKEKVKRRQNVMVNNRKSIDVDKK